MSKIVYRSKLSSIECLKRLQSHAVSWSEFLRRAFAPMDEGTIVAKVRGERFRLFAQGARYVHNSFIPLLYGRIQPTSEGTRIVGRFRMHPVVRVFMSVWFGGLAIMAVVLCLVALFGNADAGRPPFILMLGPLLMILFGIGLLSFGRRIARGQVSRLLEFLRVELEAAPEEAAGPNQTVLRTGASRFAQEVNPTSLAAGSRR